MPTLRQVNRLAPSQAHDLATALAAGPAAAADRIVFATDWLAQAEHGGFYQALAEGTYKKHGLDVEIRMGGPQVNGLQLLLAVLRRDLATIRRSM